MPTYGGFVSCADCGSNAVEMFNKLFKPCGRPSVAGEHGVSCRMTSPNYPAWPIFSAALGKS